MSWAETGLLACRAVASPELPAGDDTHHLPIPYSPYARSRAHGRSMRKLWMHSTEKYAINRHQSSIKDGRKIAHVPPFPGVVRGSFIWLLDADSVKVFGFQRERLIH
ncbi:uncharacterized protein TrAtP1_004535 [Trichoderma atroviride]|uniref:uncharacterized protein n=1 Tax=Hypocrea atroviridis TaxID=63577 RepID=UPI003324BC8F|nr:hypothetical protein TrAtP1_004535 [Trichoderma atroviride]